MSSAIHINLLDWRREARQAKQRRFLVLLAGVAAIAVVVGGVLPLAYYNHAIANQSARNTFLETQISRADTRLTEIRDLKADRAALIKRMQIIADLQQSRGAIVHFFDELTATLPDGVTLTSVKESGNTTTINGLAESNSRVSEYMTALDGSAWFQNPRLIVIKRADDAGTIRSDFTLEVDSRAAQTQASDADATASASANGP